MDLIGELERALTVAGVRRRDAIGIACSGGADSTGLLHLAARSSLGLRLCAIHVDHGARPESEAGFVREQAGALGAGFCSRTIEVKAGPRESWEAAAREGRYAALRAAAEEAGLRWVATAHTLDDQAETVLMRALRGTGVSGLSGIRPVNDIFVRPLLEVRRSDVRRWLKEQQIEWREDPTNLDVRFERNWLRAEVMSLLEARRPGVALALARLAEHARSDTEALESIAADVFDRSAVREAGGLFLPDEALAGPPAVVARVVSRMLAEQGCAVRTTSIRRVMGLRQAPAGTRASCGSGSMAWRLPGGTAVFPDPMSVPPAAALPPQGPVLLGEWGVRMRVGMGGPALAWSCVVPSGRALTVRSRRPGDRVRAASGEAKVADLLAAKGVPRPLREHVPVLCADGSAYALVGMTCPPLPSPGPGIVVDAEPLPEAILRKSWWESKQSAARTS